MPLAGWLVEQPNVAKFVQRKGRVRISALAQESNRLIDLEPRKKLEVEAEGEEVAAGGEGETGGAWARLLPSPGQRGRGVRWGYAGARSEAEPGAG